MRALQVAVGVLILGLAILGYLFFLDAAPGLDEPVAAPTADAPVDRSAAEKSPEPRSESARFMPMERDLSDEDPEGDLLLEGQVVDADNLPVAAATVSLSSRPPRQMVTGPDGTFSFGELVGRRYRLTARAGERVAGPVLHRLSATSEPLILRLRAGAAVEVRVLRAADDRPIAGAEVELRSVEDRRATTDLEGLAKVEGVAPGYATCTVRADGYAPAHKLLSVPSGSALASSVSIRLQAGAEVGGRVLDESGQGIEGARVLAAETSELFSLAEAEKDGAVSDAEGRFSMPALAAGRYRFTASHKSRPAASSKEIDLDGQRPRHDIEIVLAAGGRLAGRVEDAAGQAVPWASVRVARADEQSFAGGLTGPRRRGAVADGQGRFEIEGLPLVALLLMAQGEEASSPSLAVDLSAEPVQEDLLLRLSVDGRISGRVQSSSGEPVPEVQVVAIPDLFGGSFDAASRLRGHASAMTDGGGNFVLKGLGQGRYDLKAMRSAGSFRALQRAGVKAETGDKDVLLTLDRDGSVRGRVVYTAGGSPAAFTVSVGLPPGTPFSSPDGGFELGGLQAGTHELTIRGEDFADAVLSGVEVKADELTELGEIEVRAGRSLSGRVLDSQGRPVPGALVIAGTRLVGDGIKLTLDMGGAAAESMGMRQARSDAEGRYRLGGLGAERYLVVAEHAELGRSQPKILERHGGSSELDLVLAGLGELSGLISSNGQAVSGAIVAAVTQGESEQQFVVHAGTDGSYRFEKLAAGSYRLTGVMPTQGLGQKSTGAIVEVKAGERTRADLDIPVGEVKLTVLVSGVDGARVDTAQVLLLKGQIAATTAADLNQAALSAGGNIQGSFWSPQMAAVFEGVVPGAYSLCVVPINGNLMDPVFGQKLQKHKDLLRVYCSALDVPATPAEQSHSVAVPAMEPLP